MNRVGRMRALGAVGVGVGALLALAGFGLLLGITNPPYLPPAWNLPMALLLAGGLGLAAGSVMVLANLPRADAR